jgi:carbamoyl-phosphate synthase large subunit
MPLIKVGLPAIIRPSFTLGGTGGGIAYNVEEFYEIVERGVDASPTTEVLIEESCSAGKSTRWRWSATKRRQLHHHLLHREPRPDGRAHRRFDHRRPALTLTDKEYQIMRNASIAVLREIGVETGGSNVQFAVNPEDGRLVVIEMNPRVSRSSALASKATGFPIAKVAAKLAVGYTLDELDNDITGGATPASLVRADHRLRGHQDPALRLREVPRRRAAADHRHEVGRRGHGHRPHLPESLQKALRGLETGLTGLNEIEIEGLGEATTRTPSAPPWHAPTPDRLLKVAQACALGMSRNEQVHAHAKYRSLVPRTDRGLIVDMEERVREHGLPKRRELRKLKSMGFSDKRLADPRARQEDKRSRKARAQTLACARSTSASTPARPSSPRPPPTCTRPTSAVCRQAGNEADRTAKRSSSWAAARTGSARASSSTIAAVTPPSRCRCGYESIMVNCNPETVSTDYDTSDRLYFEPLTAEDVLEILTEQTNRHAAGRGRPVRRPDPAEAGPTRWKRPAFRSSAPRRTPSTWPKTATGSRRCSMSWG